MSFFERDDVALWIKSILAAFIGGGAASITGGLTAIGVDPGSFNFNQDLGKTLKLMIILFVTNGALAIFMYLKQSPLPGWDQVTERRSIGRKAKSIEKAASVIEESAKEMQVDAKKMQANVKPAETEKKD